MVVVVAVLTRPGDMTAADAGRFAERAFRSADVHASVRGKVRTDRFRPAGHQPVRVWVVPLTVRGRPVLLSVLRDGAQAVDLDDRAPGGGTVLDDREFLALERYRWDPAAERSTRHRAEAAGVGAVALAAALLVAQSRA